jgi:hypothetical protein
MQNNEKRWRKYFEQCKTDIKIYYPRKLYNNIYRKTNDALAETNAITNISNYRNIGYANTQEIWVA